MKQSIIALAMAAAVVMPGIASTHNVYDAGDTKVVLATPGDVYAANDAAAAARFGQHLMHLELHELQRHHGHLPHLIPLLDRLRADGRALSAWRPWAERGGK